MKSKIRLTGCAACPWGNEKEQKFVPPEIAAEPDILILAEAPGDTELQKGQPLIGKSGKIIRDILSKYDIKATLLNSAQCHNKMKPPKEVLKACKEAYVIPTLDSYSKEIPLVCLGEYAAQSILGGKRSDIKLAGKTMIVDGRVVYFTYHPAHYLYGHNPSVLENIETMIQSASSGFDPNVEYVDVD